MQNILDDILLSNDVLKSFYDNYHGEFKDWLLNIIPEVEDCYNRHQDNPWHIYNVLEHILHSVEEMNKQTTYLEYSTRRMLAYVMFFHDIGKPKSHIRRYSKLYGREVDSFFGHNIASVKIADRVLNQLNFNSQEIEVMKKLIENHDVFMFITLNDDGNSHHRVLTEEYLKEIITSLSMDNNGYTLMEYLIMVGRSDSLSQNPKMTVNSLRLLDKMENMLKKIRTN